MNSQCLLYELLRNYWHHVRTQHSPSLVVKHLNDCDGNGRWIAFGLKNLVQNDCSDAYQAVAGLDFDVLKSFVK